MSQILVDFDDIQSKETYWQYLKTLKGKRIMTDTAEKWSNQQLKYYFVAIVRPLCDYTGDTQEGVHYYLKSLFLKELTIAFGKEQWRVRDLDDVDRIEFHHFIEDCIRFCAKWNIKVHDSDTYLAALKELSLKERVKLVKHMEALPVGQLFVDRQTTGRSSIYSRVQLFDGRVLIKRLENGFGLIKADYNSEDYISSVKVADNLYRMRCHIQWLEQGNYELAYSYASIVHSQSNQFIFRKLQLNEN